MQSHYFLAVPIPNELKKIIKGTFNMEAFSFKRWVHEEDLHLTLVFLGASTEEQLENLNENLLSVLSKWNPFSLKLSDLGTFGRKEEPRIFWVGVKDEPLLHSLRQEVFKVCEKVDFKLEKRPFSPHITLARKWSGSINFQKELIKDLSLNVGWQVERVILYKSVLTEEPKYKEVASFPLSGGKK